MAPGVDRMNTLRLGTLVVLLVGEMALCLFMIVAYPYHLTLRVWGLWLSLATAAGALVLEGARSIRLKPK